MASTARTEKRTRAVDEYEFRALRTCFGEETSASAENSGLGKMRSFSSAASDSPSTTALIPEILPAPEGSCDMDSTWRSLSEEAPAAGCSPLAVPMAVAVAAGDGDGDGDGERGRARSGRGRAASAMATGGVSL